MDAREAARLEHERHRWLRPDWERYLRPDWENYVQPAHREAMRQEIAERKAAFGTWRCARERLRDEQAARERLREEKAALEAARENGGSLAGRNLEVFTDKRMCNFCTEVLPHVGLELGDPTVTFIGPDHTGMCLSTLERGIFKPT